MKNLTLLSVAVILQSIALAGGALAGSFVPVTAPGGSVSAGVIGINNHGHVTGSYVTEDDSEIGFVGSINGNYQTFQVGGNPTFPRGLNTQGVITGFYGASGILIEFVRDRDGTISDITKDGEALIGIAQGINPAGEFVGDYFRSPGDVPQRGGYRGRNALYEADIELPFPAVRVAARGINAKGDIAGWFVGVAGEGPQGFVIQSGVTTVINYPAPGAFTTVQDINNRGEISGSWTDANGDMHGFVLAPDLITWTSFDAPDSSQTQAFQLNELGQVAVNGSSISGSAMYIYCPRQAGVCSPGARPHLPANEAVVTGEVLFEPGHAPANPANTTELIELEW